MLPAARAPMATTPPMRSLVAITVRTSLHAVQQSYSPLAAENLVQLLERLHRRILGGGVRRTQAGCAV